jgi:hypothetical protein
MKILITLALCNILAFCSTLQPGADPVVVNAEQTLRLYRATAQLVVDTENQSRASLMQVNPQVALQIKHGVDVIRAKSDTWTTALVTEIEAYQTNKSAQNMNNLQKAVADISTGLAQAQTILSNINQTKGGTH